VLTETIPSEGAITIEISIGCTNRGREEWETRFESKMGELFDSESLGCRITGRIASGKTMGITSGRDSHMAWTARLASKHTFDRFSRILSAHLIVTVEVTCRKRPSSFDSHHPLHSNRN
jgi:hypothetical protein